ncbi:unnamed protein product [Protopolystoma xenopodis]|uniref:Uncharacterized protein n=1 Tax=Protopolystoma xenopodis TaxID=117903 RepID=A0A3S5CG52_9PLAT|nr:unnamed protein product [Protopolystoma xenopodis]
MLTLSFTIAGTSALISQSAHDWLSDSPPRRPWKCGRRDYNGNMAGPIVSGESSSDLESEPFQPMSLRLGPLVDTSKICADDRDVNDLTRGKRRHSPFDGMVSVVVEPRLTRLSNESSLSTGTTSVSKLRLPWQASQAGHSRRRYPSSLRPSSSASVSLIPDEQGNVITLTTNNHLLGEDINDDDYEEGEEFDDLEDFGDEDPDVEVDMDEQKERDGYKRINKDICVLMNSEVDGCSSQPVLQCFNSPCEGSSSAWLELGSGGRRRRRRTQQWRKGTTYGNPQTPLAVHGDIVDTLSARNVDSDDICRTRRLLTSMSMVADMEEHRIQSR